MNISGLTLATFLCDHAQVLASADPNAFFTSAPSVHGLLHEPRRPLGQGYELYSLVTGPADVALLYDGDLVGFYMGDLLAIDPAHTGKALSVPMVLAVTPYRPLPTIRTLSYGGRAALRTAWEVAHGVRTDPWP